MGLVDKAVIIAIISKNIDQCKKFRKHTIKGIRKSENPQLVQEAFTRVKKNLLEAGDTFPDEFILENTNSIINLKANKDMSED